MSNNIKTTINPPQSHLGRVHHNPSWQRMHSSAAYASRAMSTADKSSFLAMGMLHPYHFSPLTVDTSVLNPNLDPNPNPSYHTNLTTTAG